MPYFHVYMKYIDENGKERKSFLFDMTEKVCRKLVAIPYMKNKFVMEVKPIPVSNIKELIFFVSVKRYRDLMLPNGKSPVEISSDNIGYIATCFSQGLVPGVGIITASFIGSLTREEVEPRKTRLKALEEKKKVFIVHGRDDKPALQLQKYLRDKLKLDAEMFEDFKEKTSSNTIIEQLEYIRDNVGYALAIATPDDVGCLREEMEKLKNKMLLGRATLKAKKVSQLLEVARTRARQNVVFELGLFIGTLGRDRVCCLLQTDTQEKPSDVDGILYVGFDKHVRETFTEITEKLKKVGLVSE